MKQCPKCEQQVPVACKACPCGHVYFLARRPISVRKLGGKDLPEEPEKRTRPERTKTVRNYDTMEKLPRSPRQHRISTSTNTTEGEADTTNGEDAVPRKRRRRRKIVQPVEKEDSDKEEDVFANVSSEKAQQYSVILAEINRKICATQFKV